MKLAAHIVAFGSFVLFACTSTTPSGPSPEKRAAEARQTTRFHPQKPAGTADDAVFNAAWERYLAACDLEAERDLDGAHALVKQAVEPLVAEDKARDTEPRLSLLAHLAFFSFDLNDRPLGYMAFVRQTSNLRPITFTQMTARVETGVIPASAPAPGRDPGDTPAPAPQGETATPGISTPPVANSAADIVSSALHPETSDTSTPIDAETKEKLTQRRHELEDAFDPRARPTPAEKRARSPQLGTLADICAVLRDYYAAIARYRELLEVRQAEFGADSPQAREIELKIAAMLYGLQDFVAARDAFSKVVGPGDGDDRGDAAPPSPAVAPALVGLAQTEARLGNRSRAVRLYTRFFRGRPPIGAALTRDARADFDALLAALQLDAEAARRAGKHESASETQSLVVEGRASVDPTSLECIRAKEELAALQARRCTLDDVVALRREIVSLRQQSARADAAGLSEALRELAALLRVSGNTEEARQIEEQVLGAQRQ